MTKLSHLIGIILAALLLTHAEGRGEATKPAVAYKASPLPLSAVRLSGGPLKQAQDLDADYLLKLEPDRMLFALRKQAGLEPKAQESYGGWDSTRGKQLTGHIAGHYLSAVSYMFAATGDERFKERADYIVSELKAIQDKHGDGYIGAQNNDQGRSGKELLHEVGKGNIRAAAFDLNGLWAPWYVEHKIFAGLRDAYHLTGNQAALDVEIKFASWVDQLLSPLDDAQIQKMLNTEFGGMNEVMLDLYADTGDERWLKASRYFFHREFVEPLAERRNILPGKHGNTQVPKMLGELMRYVYTGDRRSGDAARFFWDTVVAHHSFATGGHGYDEYFGPPDKLSGQIDGLGQRSGSLRTAETCNVYNMLKMTRVLFALEPQERYAGFHERALFNHILASIDPQDGRVCYMVPVGPGVTHEYQDMFRSFTCCVGTGMESHALHAHGIYYQTPEVLWVNLYVASTAEWTEAAAKVEMETDFPEGSAATMKITLDAPKELTLAFRRPAWAGEGFAVRVNGEALGDLPPAGSYVKVKRTWKSGDTVALTLPRRLRVEPLPDNPRRVALMWGPLVLAGDLGPAPERRRRRSASAPTPSEMAQSATRQSASTRSASTRSASSQAAATVPSFRRRGPTTQAAATVPSLVAGDEAVENWLKPVEQKPGVFRARVRNRDGEVEFIPFYRLHRRMYSLYWDLPAKE